jgi:hypothetical protein
LPVSSPGRFTPTEKVPSSHYIVGWVGHRASLDAMEKRRLQTLMMGTEIVGETSVIFNQLTQLSAPENFIKSLLLLRRFNHGSWVTHSVAKFICGDGSKLYRNLQRMVPAVFT